MFKIFLLSALAAKFFTSSRPIYACHPLPATARKGWNFSRSRAARGDRLVVRGSNCRTGCRSSLHPVFHLAPFNVDLKINFAALRAIFSRRTFLTRRYSSAVVGTLEILGDRGEFDVTRSGATRYFLISERR